MGEGLKRDGRLKSEVDPQTVDDLASSSRGCKILAPRSAHRFLGGFTAEDRRDASSRDRTPHHDEQEGRRGKVVSSLTDKLKDQNPAPDPSRRAPRFPGKSPRNPRRHESRDMALVFKWASRRPRSRLRGVADPTGSAADSEMMKLKILSRLVDATASAARSAARQRSLPTRRTRRFAACAVQDADQARVLEDMRKLETCRKLMDGMTDDAQLGPLLPLF